MSSGARLFRRADRATALLARHWACYGPRVRVRVVAGAVGVVAVIATAVAAPEIARSRAEARITELLGPASIRSAELGWGRLALAGVVVEALGSFDRIEVDAGIVDLAVLGSNGISRIEVTGCDLDVDLAWVRSRDGGASEEGAGGARRPALAVDGCRVRLHDDVGVLLTLDGLAGELQTASATATVTGVELGPDAEASVATASASARWIDGRPRLATVSLASPRVHAGPALRGAIHRLTAAPARDGARDGAPDGSDAAPSLMARLASWTTDDVTLHVSDGVIVREDSEEVLLEALTATVDRDGERVATEGSGRPPNGGSIEWDLVLLPSSASAYGSLDAVGVSLAALAPFLPELPLHRPDRALVSASLSLESAAADLVEGSGSITVTELAVSHPRIAPEPVEHIAATLRGRAQWMPDERRLVLDELAVEVPGAAAHLDGVVEWAADHYLVDLHARLPSSECDGVVHAIPADLLGDLSALRLSGRLAGQLDVHVDSRDLEGTTLAIEMTDRCTFVSVPASVDPTRFLRPFHHHVVEPDGDVVRFETGPGTERWAPLASISPFVVHAVLAHEDAGFFRHHGFAPWAIREALVRNLTAGRYVMGASTITMQLVKNVFLHREKTLARKVQEVLLTWWVESVMTKEQILELYLNVIELGPAVYGIREGAEDWFGRAPSELSVAEAAYLACILPNPTVFAADHRPEGGPPSGFRRRMRNLLTHLAESGRIDETALSAGLTEIETMRFHSPGTPPPPPRVPVGSAAVLPIEGWGDPTEFGDEAETSWDLGGEEAGDDSPTSDEGAALDDTPRGWAEVP